MDENPTQRPPTTHRALTVLSEIAWMARRAASRPTMSDTTAHDDATWLLHRLAATHHVRVGHPDQTANRTFGEHAGALGEKASFYADGTPTGYEPAPERAAALLDLPEDDQVRLIADTLQPLAHAYADGRATYATSSLNSATRSLIAWGLLPPTAPRWVRDGMGDGFTGLSVAEIAERDAAMSRIRLT